jgi:hypothetical protein
LTDQALQKAIDYDQTHGLSKRFYNILNTALGTAQGVDQKLGVTQRAVAVDEKYAIQEKAKSTATGFMRYFENALGSPTGKKVRTFYDDRKKEALEIHAEARRYIPTLSLSCTNVRLADERKGTTGGTSDTAGSSEPVQAQTTTGLGVTAPTSEKTGL